MVEIISESVLQLLFITTLVDWVLLGHFASSIEGWVNPYILVKWVTFFWVTWITRSNHRKLDNPVYTFKNSNHGFRTRISTIVNIRLSLVLHSQTYVTGHLLIREYKPKWVLIICNQQVPCNEKVWLPDLDVCYSKSIKPAYCFSTLCITLALCILLNFCTTEYFVLHKIFLRARVADYFSPHQVLFLSTVS